MEDTPTPNNEFNSEVPVTEQSQKPRRLIFILVFVIIGLVVLATVIFFIQRNQVSDVEVVPPVDLPVEAGFRSSLQASVSGDNPVPLQDFFAEKVVAGESDDEAKSAIYWIAHRYFDNGGNIYEIYDFIQERPEIAFLNEAESIYPFIFADIKERKVANFSTDSLLALLAYYEVIDTYGYADIGIWGMTANRYAELAYKAKRFFNENKRNPNLAEGELERTLDFINDTIKRSRQFMEKANLFLYTHTVETGSLDELYKLNMIPDDLLVGLNQYGAALENLKGLGITTDTAFDSAELYAFNYELAKTRVPRLYFFTNYLYASSLVYGGGATAESVALPLSRAMDYTQTTDRVEWRKSVSRVINSKVANENGMYAYDTVKTLASLNSDFKSWLMKEGWTEADF